MVATVYDADPTLNQHWCKVSCLLGKNVMGTFWSCVVGRSEHMAGEIRGALVCRLSPYLTRCATHLHYTLPHNLTAAWLKDTSLILDVNITLSLAGGSVVLSSPFALFVFISDCKGPLETIMLLNIVLGLFLSTTNSVFWKAIDLHLWFKKIQCFKCIIEFVLFNFIF